MAAAPSRSFAPIALRTPVALTMVLLPLLAHAEGAPAQDLGGSLFQMFLGLLAVLLVMVASLWFLKRLSAPRGEAGHLMRVIAGTAVGARERVVVLEIGTTWLVLGVAPGRVTALAELPRTEVPADAAGPKSDFAQRLRQMVSHRDAR